jgi:hypothetical protein
MYRFRIAATYKGLSAVAGDCNRFLSVDVHCIGIFVPGVAGHGVASLSRITKNADAPRRCGIANDTSTETETETKCPILGTLLSGVPVRSQYEQAG